MDPRVIFAANLARALKKQRVKVKELAEHVSVSVQSVYRWLKGESLPPPEHLKIIAERLFWDYPSMFSSSGEDGPDGPDGAQSNVGVPWVLDAVKDFSGDELAMFNHLHVLKSTRVQLDIAIRQAEEHWPRVKNAVEDTQ